MSHHNTAGRSCVLVLHPDRTITSARLEPDSALTQLYSLIECTAVDVVRLTTTIDMWLDDEGLCKGAPFNPDATLLAAHHGYHHQPYYGTAVIAASDHDGNTINLTDEQTLVILTHLDRTIQPA